MWKKNSGIPLLQRGRRPAVGQLQRGQVGGDVSCSFGVATSLHPTVAGSNPGHSSLKVFIFL
jgi:hypothetical protein